MLPMKSSCGATALAVAILLSSSTPANAQWSAISLHPGVSGPSIALSTTLVWQVGQVTVGGVGHASLWSGSAAGWVDLHPGIASSSTAFDISGPQQVGQAIVGGESRASLWNLTSGSWVSLHPENAIFSIAYGTNSAQQVGEAIIDNKVRASLWSGGAGSWVDLSPPGATASTAYDIFGSQQVGRAEFGGDGRAGLWNGTPGSWVSLHPAGSPFSEALATTGARQVGHVTVGSRLHASLWAGTPESWVDLHPDGATESSAVSVSGNFQVGNARFGTRYRASFWNGTAESWEDLSLFLPPGSWRDTYAESVWSNGTTTYVAGYGRNLLTGNDEALLWRRERAVSGNITLEGWGASPEGIAIVIEIRDVGSTTPILTINLNLDASGNFSFPPEVPVGTYDVSAKALTSLRQLQGNVGIIESGATGVNFLLTNGDCDGDNEIAIGDFALLSAAFASDPGSPHWNPVADLDGDQEVTIGDYAILSNGYGLFGDE